MRVNQHLIANAKRVQAANELSYNPDGKKWITLGNLPYNDAGQTPNEVCSFTYALAHMLSTSGGPFITALTEEAASYIDDWAVDDYFKRVREACARANVEFPAHLSPGLSA